MVPKIKKEEEDDDSNFSEPASSENSRDDDRGGGGGDNDDGESTRGIDPLSYPYTPTEKLVLTLEPYKSKLLPYWRFKTPEIARKSASELWAKFLEYDEEDDFVGMDMARKYIQMGMTRAKRYANYSGGRKYAPGSPSSPGKRGEQLAKSSGHEGKQDKEEASAIFREVWERCKAHEGYCRRKEEWMAETRRLKKVKKVEESGEVKVKNEKVKKEESGDEGRTKKGRADDRRRRKSSRR